MTLNPQQKPELGGIPSSIQLISNTYIQTLLTFYSVHAHILLMANNPVINMFFRFSIIMTSNL